LHPGWLAVICLVSLSAAAARRDERPETTADVELAVRDPQGKPLVGAAVEILPLTRDHPQDKRAPVKATTDDRGVARFSWPVRVDRVRILAEGVGYGATGAFEVLEGKIARPSAPPLVPYGVIEGTVAKALLQPGTCVCMPEMDTGQQRRATCDAEGRFVLEDVPCGVRWLRALAGDKPLGIEARVRVEPGRRVRALFHKSEEPVIRPEPPVQREKEKEEQVVWAAGVVRDEQGRPVEGAAVYAIASYHGGLRMYETIRSAQTDDKGRWEIKGEGSLSMFSGGLLARKPGRPPAFLPLPVPDEEARAKDDAPYRNCELVLSDQGGRLEVTVLGGDKPLAKAAVQLAGAGGPHLYNSIYVGAAREPERDEVESILHPTATTDDDGVARFRDLVPGVYSIYTAAGNAGAARAVRENRLWSDRTVPHAACSGVAVRAGETRKFQLAAYPQPNRVRLRVLQPDGKPITNRSPAFEWGEAVSGAGWSSGLNLDENGAGEHDFEAPGLWRVSFHYRDSPVHQFPIRGTPYYEAAGVVAVSPLLENGRTVALTAYRHEPGVLVVQLQDLDGKPAHGAVLIDRFAEQPALAGSTDDKGVGRFEGVEAWEHDLEAHLDGLDVPDLRFGDAPFPKDEELIGRAALFPQKVATANDRETSVTIRPTRVGHVRGVVRPPKGRPASDYGVQCYEGSKLSTFAVHYDGESGEFVLGPLAEGKATVRVICRTANWAECAAKELEVRNDKVARAEFTPPAEVKPQAPGGEPAKALLGVGGLSLLGKGPEGVRGQVLLSDGKTPAAAARLAVFLPDVWSARGWGGTDARGRIYMEETVWQHSSDKPGRRPGSPEGPVVVAWLPGACGATVAPLAGGAEQPLKVVLPPPLRVQGKVTVGGKAVQGRKNQFRVLAAYEGKGKLDGLLSAEADGGFELAGLTPGTYQVQAAMDGIWLSRAVRLTVKPGAAPPEALTLDIGEPGPASVLELVRRDGKPVPGGTATVVRPEGPLTDLLWPAEFTADGAGAIRIPPLEAGGHKVRVTGAAGEQMLEIPALLDAQAEPMKARVVVE
jgi:protocatechuate 3,4-dioxygenase beta subunit